MNAPTKDRTAPMNPHYRPPGIRQACGPSGGSGGLDARGTDAQSTRDCRKTADERPAHRIKAPVTITGGYVVGADSRRRSVRRSRPWESGHNPAPVTAAAYGGLDWSKG